jgi:hypothetical protein
MDARHAKLEQALSDFDFDQANALAVQIESDDGGVGLIDRVRTERAHAETSARDLHLKITDLARRHDYRSLLEIVHSPSTARLLALLPEDTKSRSEVHLLGAERWSQRQVDANRRRLDEVAKAVASLDLEFASGVLRRLDEGFLDQEMRDRRNQLLLDITARTIELEELEASASKVVAEERPPRWWRRRRRSS